MYSKLNPVSRIINLVKLERREIIDVYFFAIFSGLIQLSVPLGVQSIIGFVVGGAVSTSLVILIVLVIGGVWLTGLMQINQMRVIEKVQQRIFARYAFAFSEKIPRVDLKKADSFYLPELVNRFFDVSILQKGLSKLLLEIPAASIQILFGLILLAFYHPAFILFGFLLLAILWLILYYTGSRGLQTSLEESQHKYAIAAWLEEMARAIKSMKFSSGSRLQAEKTDSRVSDYLDARTRHFRILLQQFFTLVGFKVIITAAMLIVGTHLLLDQQLNIGQFIAAEIVIILVINSVEKLIGNLDNVYDVLTSVEKLGKLIDKPEEANGVLPFTPGKKGVRLAMRDVAFGYEEQAFVLQRISLDIRPGEKVAVAGADGAGKSTLLKLFTGAYQDFKGSILIDQVPIGNYDLDSLRSRTGILLNQQDIFAGTIWENLTLSNPDADLSQINALAEQTGLSAYLSTLPKGYETYLDPTGKRLPRNVVQKILLVRALANNPALLLLEEPWSGIEEKNKKPIQDMLLKDLQATTILVATNDPVFLRQADKIIYLTGEGCRIVDGREPSLFPES